MPDDTVYIATRWRDHSRVYHTDRSCRALNRAERILKKPRSLIKSHRRECAYCSGAYETPTRSPDRSYYESLRAEAEGSLE